MTLPFLRPLRPQQPENLVMLLGMLFWIGSYDLHDGLGIRDNDQLFLSKKSFFNFIALVVVADGKGV